MEVEVRGHGSLRCQAAEGHGGRTCRAEEDVCRTEHREPGDEKPDRKKAITPSEKREAAGYLVEQEQLSVRKACKIVAIPRSTYEYKAIPKDDAPVQEALTSLTHNHVAIGFWQS